MRNLLLPLLLGVACVSCIDKDYDLKTVNTDNITIGDVLRFPLVNLTIGMQDISQGNADIETIFTEADLWLPTSLPDTDQAGNQFFDLTRIKDQRYTNALADALIAQMLSDAKKFEAVVDLICRDYKAHFTELLQLPANVDVSTFRPMLIAHFAEESALQTQARKLALEYLGKIYIEDVHYKIDRIGLSEQIIDMLAKDLDTGSEPQPSLYLYGQIQSKLPVSLSLQPAFNPSPLKFDITIDATKSVNTIEESADTKLTEQSLRQIVNGIDIAIPVTLKRYYPGIGFHSGEKDQIVIKLSLIKRGGLNLNL